MQRSLRLLIILPFLVVGTVAGLILIVHGREALSDIPKFIASVGWVAPGLFVVVAVPLVLVMVISMLVRDRREPKGPPSLPEVRHDPEPPTKLPDVL